MNVLALRHVAPAVALMTLAGSAFAQVGGTPVAVSGQATGDALSTGSANGTNGLAFSANSFSAAGRSSVINANGDVVFLGAFAGGVGAWRNTAGSNANTNLARGGTAVPAHSDPSVNYSNTLAWASPFVDSSGNAAFYNTMAGTTGPAGSPSDSGIFRADGAGVVNFATRGRNTGGLGGTGLGRDLPADHSATPAFFPQANANSNMALMNAGGVMLLNGSWNTGTVNGNGLYIGTANAGAYDTLTPVFIRGDLVDAAGFTGMAGDFTAGHAFNDNGQAAFNLDVQSGTGTPGRTSSQNRGLGTNRSGSLEMLVLAATAPSWVPAGTSLTTFGSISPSINNAGQIGLAMNLATGTGGVTSGNDGIIGRFNVDNSVSVMREGQATPRQTAGGNTILLAGTFGSTLISHSGTIFASTNGNYDSAGNTLTAATGNAALFGWSPEAGVRIVALSGDTAPGTGGGQFATFGTGRAVNANDQVAFMSNLITTAGNPGGVTTANDLCLFATDINGNPILIAREGFALPGDPVAGRTVSTIIFGSGIGNLATNGEDGRGTFFNALGQLVFNVGFSDGGSGVFVANVAPTPGAAAVIGLGALAGLRRRRQA